MPRACEICSKTVSFGNKVERRGLAKKKGGVGKKITGKSRRKYLPNLQSIRIRVNGGNKRATVCTRCIKGGKIQKAV